MKEDINKLCSDLNERLEYLEELPETPITNVKIVELLKVIISLQRILLDNL